MAPPLEFSTGLMRAWLREESEGIVLSLTGLPNRPEILYRLCAVLYAYNWNIGSALIRTTAATEIEDRFVIRPLYAEAATEQAKFAEMIEDYRDLLMTPSSVAGYLDRYQKKLIHRQTGRAEISFGRDPIRLRVRVSVPDRPGLLLSILHIFSMMGIDILAAQIETDHEGVAQNTFLVNPGDERFERESFRTLLGDGLKILL